MSKKYESLAKEILEKIGGSENISTSTHCMTRLRFNLKDRSKTDDVVVKNIEGVIDVIEKGGQFQVVIGTHVGEVYEEIVKLGGGGSSSNMDTAEKSDLKWHQKVLDVIAGSFTPVIGAISGAGMIKVVVLLLTMTGILSTESTTYHILNYVSDAAFYFLPFLLAYSSSIKFKTNTPLALVMAGILMHPEYGKLGQLVTDLGVKEATFFGIPVHLVMAYSASVIPILLIVWVMSYVERFAKKVSPNCLKIFLAPMITILVMTPLALCALGPVGSIIGDWMADGFGWLNNTVPWLTPFLMGAFTPLLVMTGMHYSLAPIGMAEFATFGYGTFLMTGMVCSNVAQGVASFAASLRTKDKNLKQVAASSGITGVMGITEPALYGVNLPLKYPLISALIGGGCAGLYAGLMGVKNFASASPGIAALPVFIGSANGGDPMTNFMHACIMVVISMVVTFTVAYILGGMANKKEENQGK